MYNIYIVYMYVLYICCVIGENSCIDRKYNGLILNKNYSIPNFGFMLKLTFILHFVQNKNKLNVS